MQRLQKGNSKAKSARKVLDVFSRIQRARVTLAVWRTSGELWCARVRLSLECNFRMWSPDGHHISIESLYVSMLFWENILCIIHLVSSKEKLLRQELSTMLSQFSNAAWHVLFKSFQIFHYQSFSPYCKDWSVTNPVWNWGGQRHVD